MVHVYWYVRRPRPSSMMMTGDKNEPVLIGCVQYYDITRVSETACMVTGNDALKYPNTMQTSSRHASRAPRPRLRRPRPEQEANVSNSDFLEPNITCSVSTHFKCCLAMCIRPAHMPCTACANQGATAAHTSLQTLARAASRQTRSDAENVARLVHSSCRAESADSRS